MTAALPMLALSTLAAVPPIQVIPTPQNVVVGEGTFRGRPIIEASPPAAAASAVELLRQKFAVRTSPHAPRSGGKRTEFPIRFRMGAADSSLGTEGYRLTTDQSGATISAAAPAGFYYAAQTLRQLGTWDHKGGVLTVPHATITDRPRYPWRGFMLDSSRHFMTKEFIKNLIDIIAGYKLNRFHWHLTDDQGWRIEIQGYPRLTSIGAWRGKGETRHGGYYSQEDIRDVVAYAAERQITVVPEIDMPGHVTAMLAAYPQLSCSGSKPDIPSSWGIFPSTLCPCKEETFEILETILDEVLTLFPSPYIHVGGDEVVVDGWRADPQCKKLMASRKLTASQLQGLFTARVAEFLATRGRKTIVWDESLDHDPPRGVVIQGWRYHGSQGPAAEAVRRGFQTIVSPMKFAYLNRNLDVLDLADVHAFEPVPSGLSPEQQARIMGGEALLWTEYAPQPKVHAKSFPRLLAMAEVLWSESKPSFQNFHSRVRHHAARLGAEGIDFGRALPRRHLVAKPIFPNAAEVKSLHFEIAAFNDEAHPVEIRLAPMTHTVLRASWLHKRLVLQPGERQQVGIDYRVARSTPLRSLQRPVISYRLISAEIPNGAAADHRLNLGAERWVTLEAREGVVVDGLANDWPKLGQSVDRPRYYRRKLKNWQGSADSSFKFAVSYDKTRLNIIVSVIDDTLVLNADKYPWKQDGVELRVQTGNGEESEQYTKGLPFDDYVFVAVSPLKRDDGSLVAYQPERWPEGTKASSTLTATGYVMEFSVPLTDIRRAQGTRWQSVRINVAVNDYDSADDSGLQMWWRPDWSWDTSYPGSGMFYREAAE